MSDDGFVSLAMGLGLFGLLVAVLIFWKFRSALRDNAKREKVPQGTDER